MQQIGSIWANLDKKRQILLIGSVVIVAMAFAALARIAASPSMSLLYAGLENGAAGEVVRALEQEGTPYEVRGGSIYVPGDRRDELRLTLASEGLPANGGRGYELLDSLNGFGTTSRMFDAAYWRAKEGELARTIVAGPHVSQARVHIAKNSAEPFQRAAETTASVSVTAVNGQISRAQADAIRYLVASAVTGLTVENVAVIDSRGTVIGESASPAEADLSETRADRLRERVMRLLEARVGRGNAIVEVSVETVTETESLRERRFDPNERVAISTEVEEQSDSSSNQSNDVTVASNLPDGDGATDDSSKSVASSTRERVNYEVSETELEILRLPGAIKRLSVAVLVNDVTTTLPDGSTTNAPRPEAELVAMQELVASAVGFDAERGDVITIKSMQMPVQTPIGTEVGAPTFWQNTGLRPMPAIQLLTLGVVILGLGVFVIRPILTSKHIPRPAQLALQTESQLAQPGVTQALSGEIQSASASDEPSQLTVSAAQPAPSLPGRGGEAFDRLHELVGDHQSESVEILRGWLEESRESA